MTDVATSAVPSPRLPEVDRLRGLVMIIMALDHARDFFHAGAVQGDPELLADPGLALFLTRWITHFCAPVFVFLAGTGAFLSLGRGRSRADLARFLVSRGLWLVVLEATVVAFGWSFRLSFDFLVLQVIWALGVSMCVLGLLVRLPLPAIAGIGAVMVLGHNAFDGVQAVGAGIAADLWRVLHEGGMLALGREAVGSVSLFGGDAPPAGVNVYIRYPLLPWPGIMALGFAFGAVLQQAPELRRRWTLRLGLGATAAFVGLRLIGLYGDPRPFAGGADAAGTLISFLNAQKYPPSLQFTLMTLGPALLLLLALERWQGRMSEAIATFGRVPLFYYVLHVPLLRAGAMLAALVRYGPAIAEMQGPPPDWGFTLPVVYVAWIGAVLLLYPACRWFAGVKARRRDWWLSYL